MSEGNDEVRSELLKSLGSWMKGCSDVTDGVMRVVNGALTGKEVLKNASLNALALCRDHGSLFSNVSSEQSWSRGV